MSSQVCSICKQSLPFELFTKEKRSKTGYAHRCKKCYNEYSKKRLSDPKKMEHRRNQKRENYHKNIVLEGPRKKDRERKLRNYHKSSKIGLVRFRNNLRKTIYIKFKNKKF